MSALQATLAQVFGLSPCPARRKPRPKSWEVTFSTPVGRLLCTGVYTRRSDAEEAARDSIRPDCVPGVPTPRY